MTYKVFFKTGSPATVEGVKSIFDSDTEIKLVDEEGYVLCFVSKSEYECILKVE